MIIHHITPYLTSLSRNQSILAEWNYVFCVGEGSFLDEAVSRCTSNISPYRACIDQEFKMSMLIIALTFMDVFAGQVQIQAISFMILLSNIYDTVLIGQTFIQSIVAMNASH